MNSGNPLLRYAVIGAGAAVFKLHLPGLCDEGSQLAAVAEVDPQRRELLAGQVSCPVYADYRRMLDEVAADVAVVLAPHPLHSRMVIDALERGCHVLVEKPMAAQVAEADEMLAAAERAGRLLAVSFQQRLRPEIRAAREMIRNRALGDIQYVDMVETWTRTAAYYRMSPWRGTWRGEGAGVLLNQAPHNLDLLCHLVGMPERVTGWTRTLLHRIETEDTFQALVEWPGGALGHLHISTAEAGVSQRMEIVGTAGRLQIGKGQLKFARFAVDLREHVARSEDGFSAPAITEELIDLPGGAGDHLAVYRNLRDAVLRGAPLLVDGAGGRMSLELANAIAYSSHLGCQVNFPLDRQAYVDFLDARIRHAERAPGGER
jgi:predicted dehydrogenase